LACASGQEAIQVEFKEWLGQAWHDHGTDAAGVASRILGEGAALAKRGDDVGALGRLAHHVYGEHLARYDDGRACLSELRRHAHGSDASTLLREFDASLALSGNAADDRATFDEPARIRITALAADNLVEHDCGRAAALLEEGVAMADEASLEDRDPACRALAIAGNHLACALESRDSRTVQERAAMIFAAQTARKYWARAGTWLETERAEYRLSQTWRRAGELEQARRHALRCLEIVGEHGSPALEAFFGFEALALVERDASHAAEQASAVAGAREAFARLEESDRDWCKPSFDALGA